MKKSDFSVAIMRSGLALLSLVDVMRYVTTGFPISLDKLTVTGYNELL
jgi:hypothetical protein